MNLVKPFWTPPSWVFPPVWSALYLMIAVAGWKIFAGSSQVLKGLWVAQLLFNGLWSWLFFGQHRTGWALLDIAAMLFCIAAIQIYSRKEAPIVFWLMAPYLAWVGYASTLNAAIFILN